MNVTLKEDLPGHKDAVYKLVKNGEEGNEFYSVSGDGMVVLWNLNDLENGRAIASFDVAVYSLIVIPNSPVIVVGLRFGSIYFIDTKEKKILSHINVNETVYDLCLLNDAKTIVGVTIKGQLVFIDIEKMELKETRKVSEENGRHITLSEDGTRLYTGWSDGTVKIYDSSTLEETYSFEANEKSVFCILQDTKNHRLLTGGRDARIKIWDMQNGFEAFLNIPAHNYTVNAMVFSPDKLQFASASRDKSVKIWDTASLELLKVVGYPKYPEFHTHSVNSIIWFNESTIISAGDDKKIKIWTVS